MKALIWVLTFGMMLISQVNGVYAKEELTGNNEASFENAYFEAGYKSAEDALRDFEIHYHTKLKLPIKLPAIPFTHHFGKFVNPEGEMNEFLEIEYVNYPVGINGYSITVRPIKHELKVPASKIDKTYKLKDGTEAMYTTKVFKGATEETGMNLLIFTQDGWQYVLSINKLVADKVAASCLVDIAESIK